MSTLGERLVVARKKNGFTQEALADTIGVSRGVIYNIEKDKTTDPQKIVINAICQTLNINIEWLLYNEGDMTNSTESMKSAKILSEIYSTAKELSEEEQLYILNMVNMYKNHIKQKSDL